MCRRCGREFGFLARLGHDKKDHYCRTCSSQIGQLLPYFRAKFLEVTRYGSLNSTDWIALQSLAAQERLDMQEALAFICKDAVGLIERSVAQAEANGGITPKMAAASKSRGSREKRAENIMGFVISTISPVFQTKTCFQLA
jgi:hypothetical protein